MTERATTVLVTGGTGFLGSNLLRRLATDPCDLIALKRSTSNLSRLAGLEGRIRFYDADAGDKPMPRIFDENRIDVVVHCATNYGREAIPPSEIIEANLMLPLTLLQLAALHGTTTFINTDTILDKRVNHYSLSKAQFLEWFAVFAPRLVCANVALEHFYGPYDDPSKFVSYVVQQLIAEVPSLDLTAGEQRRDFVFVDDVVEAFVAIIRHSLTTRPGMYEFQVGTGTSITIADFVRAVKALADNDRTQLNFGALPYREREVMESRADIRSLLALGWRPRVQLLEGLHRTITLERQRSQPCGI